MTISVTSSGDAQPAGGHAVTAGPDVDRLIVGGRARRRRRNLTRAGGAALAVVLVGGGAYAVTQDRSEARGSRIANQPTGRPSRPSAVRRPCRMTRGPSDLAARHLPDPGGCRPGGRPDRRGPDVRGRRLERRELPDRWRTARATAGSASTSPVPSRPGPDATATWSPATWRGARPSLAQQLATLPGSTVLQPAKPTELLGRYAFHVQVRIPQTCPMPQYYRVAETPRGGRGITYDRPDPTWPPVVMDFWVMELEGDRWWSTRGTSRVLPQTWCAGSPRPATRSPS